MDTDSSLAQDPEALPELDYFSLVKPLHTQFATLQASQIESTLGGNTPGMSPARDLHLASEGHVEACNTYATSRRMTAGDGEYRGATVKSQLTSRLKDIEKKTDRLLLDENSMWPENARKHLERRRDLLQDLTELACMAADPHGFRMKSCASDLRKQLPSIASHSVLHRAVSDFARETEKLATGHKKYAGEKIHEYTTGPVQLESQAEDPDLKPAFEDLFSSASVIVASLQEEMSVACGGDYDALGHVLDTMFYIDEEAKPHLWDMYGVPMVDGDNEEPIHAP
jgi:hypothetical protein